jgi:dipeptidyl aminopeptidase/acylaminoacyl peptidase
MCFKIFVSVLSFGLSGVAFGNEPLSAFDLFKPSTYANVEMSPNGRNVAFVQQKIDQYCLDRYGKMVDQGKAKCKDKHKSYRVTHGIIVYDLKTSEVSKRIKVPENYLVKWVDWGNDDRLLAAITRPTTVGRSGTKFTIGGSRVLSFSLSEQGNLALFEGEKGLERENRNLSQIVNMLRSDPEHVIMPARKGGDLDLWKVSILDGSAERIATGKSGTFYWFTDRAGKAVMRFDCVGFRCRKIQVYKPVGPDAEWKKIKSFKLKPDETEDEYDFWPIAPTDNPDHFYVMSNEETDKRRSVKVYDMVSETYIRTVYEHPKVDVSGPLLDLQTGEYAGVYYYEDRLNYDFVDKSMQKHFNALNKYFDNEHNVSVLGYNEDGTQAVFYVTSPNNPGEYHIYDFDKKFVELLFERKPELGSGLPSRTDALNILTRDGQKITGYHTYPNTGAGPDIPLLIMPHGGPEQRDYYDYDANVQFFVSRGYQVLQTNFRGSSGYGREFAEAGYGEWGGRMQDDVVDSIKYLYDRNLASAENACIVGYSYGGYVALYAAAKTPELFKCVVSGGGVSDIIKDMKATRSDYGKSSETYEYWLKSMGDPKTDKEKLDSISPINMAEKFSDPVLLIHGEYDGIVEYKQSEDMNDALEKAGKSVEFITLEDAGHSGWGIKTHVLYLETIEEFVGKHLTGAVGH